MAKRKKTNVESDMSLYYIKNGQGDFEFLEEAKKKKEREKRIIEENRKREKNEKFDNETEMVIEMTNKNKIKMEEQQRKIKNKEEIKRKKRNKIIKFFIKLILLIVCSGGGLAFALISPIFNIQDIKVLNNSIVSADTIISLSGLSKEQNIFKFLKISVNKKIKENPYIEDVKIHRKLPGTVEIEVEERTPEYSIQVLESYAYLSQQGYILEISEENKGLPIILGIKNPEELNVGERLDDETLTKLEDVIKITNLAKKYDIYKLVTSIDISNKNEYSIYIEQENKTIHLGDNTNLSDKMLNAVTIMEKEKNNAGEIFVNGDLNNKFQPYFREKV